MTSVSDFSSMASEDALNALLNTSEFAETISYTPYGGAAKSIKAIVTRNRLDPNGQVLNKTVVAQVEIFIMNDATDGVATITKGRDTVSLPVILGGANSTWRITDIMSHDAAVWRLVATK